MVRGGNAKKPLFHLPYTPGKIDLARFQSLRVFTISGIFEVDGSQVLWRHFKYSLRRATIFLDQLRG